MADDIDDSQKTEEPSQRRLGKAREKGQVVQSREINNWFMIGTSLGLLVFVAPATARTIGAALLPYLESPERIAAGDALWSALGITLETVGGALLLPLGLLLAAAVAGALVQTGIVFASEKIVPKLENLSPARGFSRLFSMRSLAEFAKTLAKLAVVVAVAAALMRPELGRIATLSGAEAGLALSEIARLAGRLGFGVFIALTFIAILDYGYQRFSFMRSMRMSKQEVKEEHKQSEGDPMIRARLRQIRMDRARKRMMAAVPTASVVVTNPTHYAVALKYEMGMEGAPKVVAKGADLIAQRIREVAQENKVPIVENPPLARALYGGVELDREIPPEHYRAVAEIIGYVLRLQGKLRPRAGRA
ncbi:MAG TPA: flagellar biosynthesis protein FlhB [Stellaceae bacterium]|nr:flagellar biosynthesis protein FlhB [Stellaceae bacterium]